MTPIKGDTKGPIKWINAAKKIKAELQEEASDRTWPLKAGS